MEIIRAAEIMATHPEHQRLPRPEIHALGSAFTGDHYCPLIEASVPLVDCGFMHADAVYDVVSVSRGAFFRLDQHQDRFGRACEAIRVRNPFTREEDAEILHKIVALAGLLASATMPVNAFVAFDSGQVRPLAMSPGTMAMTLVATRQPSLLRERRGVPERYGATRRAVCAPCPPRPSASWAG